MSTGTSVVDPRQKLMEQAKAMQERISAPSGDKIQLTKKKTFKLPGGIESPVNTPLSVVILDFVSYNAYFDRPFSEKDKTPPACIALGTNPDLLVPSAKSPSKQSEACKGCPNNEFGSKGNGKACGNHRLLAVIAAPNEQGVVDPKADRYLLQISPTGVKHFDAYVTQVLAKHGMGPLCVISSIWFDPDKDYASLRFGEGRLLSKTELAHYYGLQEAATKRLLTEPDMSGYTPLAKKPGR